MTSQASINYMILCDFTISPALPGPIGGQTASADSQDCGFDIDEDELARALIAPLSASLVDQPISPVEADDFDMLYHWFIS